MERVINTMKFENRDVYKITSDGKRQKISYRASHNHILPIIEVYGNNNISRVINISIDDYNKKSDNWKKQTKIFTASVNNSCNTSTAFEVKYDKKETVYGFTLSGATQWYITDDYIVTHNTGKSVYMHNIGVNAYLGKNNALSPLEMLAQDCGHNVLYFSLEMPKESIERRIDSCMGDLYYNQIRDGKLSPDDKKKYFNVLKFQMKYNKRFYVVDMPQKITTRDIELKYMEILDSNFLPELVIVDYMGIMRPNDNPNGSANGVEADWLSLGQITEDLHTFARVYNVPVITGSQVNKPKDASKPTYDTNRIARSGMAATNANIVIQIGKREDEYLRTDMPVFITKMRDGEQGSYTLNKNFAKMKVTDLIDVGFDEQENDSI
jgi:hypothetical protein